MRTKGSLGSVPVTLALLNKVLKPNASIMVSKKFADSILMLNNTNEEDEAISEALEKPIEKLTEQSVEDAAPIAVETY